MNYEHGDFNHLMPDSFTAPIAALLLHTERETLDSLTRSGAIMALPGESWNRYSRGEIERILGRRLTITEVWQAEAAHRPRKEANRRYNLKRRSKDHPALAVEAAQ
jgi:hypothetical protein